MAITFQQVITDEAVTYARVAQSNPGWYLTPVRWAISSSSGELNVNRTTSSMYPIWIQQPFSGIYSSGTNKLLHSIVIPPDAYSAEINIGEIYFIYKDFYGNEFLYAIAQPLSTLVFSPGVSQSYSFAFTLNNTNVADTFTIDYTYPQDIEDHNQKEDSHSYLLAKDGTRTATNILKYENKLEFNDPRQIVDKEYTDNITNKIQNDINNMYCPPGIMAWWPKSTPPLGWLVRDGAAYSRSTYSALFNAIGTTYGAGDGTTTFNVPDDRGLFIRGYQADVSAAFGQKQSENATIPNTGWSTRGNHNGGYKGYLIGASGNNEQRENLESLGAILSPRSCSNIRPVNRNYLPIIKY